MIGGFLRGVLAGVAVAAAALVVLSVLTEAPPSAVPPDLGASAGAPEAPVAPTVTESAPPGPEVSSAPPATAPVQVLSDTPEAEAAPLVSAAPAEPPAAISAEAPPAPDVPLMPAGAPDVTPPTAEVGPPVQGLPIPPELPQDEPAPTLAETLPALEPQPSAPSAGAPVSDSSQADAGAPVALDDATQPVAPLLPSAVPEAPTAEVVPELEVEQAPATPQAETAPDSEAAKAVDAAPDQPADAMPDDIALADDPPAGPTPGLGADVEGVTVDRLPQIGDAPADPDPAAPAEEGLAVDQTDLPPLQRDARAFENPEQKPLFAIILIDTGEASLDRAALAAIPFPVSFALDPMDPATPGRVKLYREAGQEVLMLATGLPEGAEASDVEVALSVMGDAIPQAVAVLDTPAGAFQDNRPLATGVIPVIASQGRGVLTWDRGLNAADQVARRNGVPAAVIFRLLDAEGEAAPVVRRYLDRAAFKAAQEGRVVVAGTTRPETVAALMEWAVEGRSASVALAPVTAVLSLP